VAFWWNYRFIGVGSIKLFYLSSEGRYMRYIRDFFLLCSYSFKKSAVDLAFDLIIETSILFMQYVWGIWVRVQYGKKWLNGSGMFVRGLILLLRLFIFRGFCKISLVFMVFKWCSFYRRVVACVIWWFLWNRDNRHFWFEWKSFNLTEF
jgi:hypothetical protein